MHAHLRSILYECVRGMQYMHECADILWRYGHQATASERRAATNVPEARGATLESQEHAFHRIHCARPRVPHLEQVLMRKRPQHLKCRQLATNNAIANGLPLNANMLLAEPVPALVHPAETPSPDGASLALLKPNVSLVQLQSRSSQRLHGAQARAVSPE